MTLLEQIAEAALQAKASSFPEQEFEGAIQCLIDTLGCGLAGSAHPTYQKLVSAFDSDPQGVSAIATQKRLRPEDAIIAGAAAVRLDDFNDIYSGRNNLHPSETVIPAALAFGERENWSGEELLRSVILGYRVYIGIGELWEGLLEKGWAPTATTGRIAAAAHIGLLMELTQDELAHAMALAGLNAPTLGVVFRGQLSKGKSLVNGLAVQGGWQACRFAKAGLTGPLDMVEGTSGYNTQLAGDFDEARLQGWEQFGTQLVWRKAYPTVFTIHAAIQAASELHHDDSWKRENLAGVKIHASAKVIRLAANPARWHAETPEAAQFSLPFCVAVALCYGDCRLEHLQEENLYDPQVRAMMEYVEVEEDSRFAGYKGARVNISTSDGQTLERQVSTPRGHWDAPLSAEDINNKFLQLARHVCTEQAAGELLEQITNIKSSPTINPLLKALREAPQTQH